MFTCTLKIVIGDSSVSLLESQALLQIANNSGLFVLDQVIVAKVLANVNDSGPARRTLPESLASCGAGAIVGSHPTVWGIPGKRLVPQL